MFNAPLSSFFQNLLTLLVILLLSECNFYSKNESIKIKPIFKQKLFNLYIYPLFDSMDPFMLFWTFLIGIIVGVIGGISLVYRAAVSPLHHKIEKLSTEKQSLSTTYGKITEQFAPFMNNYPYSTKHFRFIGSPIDGIQFNENQILFVEFKTNKSKLTNTQNKIKKLVKERKIAWFEFRMK